MSHFWENLSPERQNTLESFAKVLDTVEELRVKCPWDIKQTPDSLRPLTIEEVFELSQSILDKNPTEIKKEIGDVLLHLVFYALLFSETKDFTFNEVCVSLVQKLIYRHPHIYGEVKVENEEEVKKNWEKIKQTEAKNNSVLGGVPKNLPSLLKSYRIQEKAANIGFDWKETEPVFDKIREEIQELEEEYRKKSPKEYLENEFGDVLFSLVNLSRFLKIDPDTSLERTNQKFISRFNYIENQAKIKNKPLSDMTLGEMESYWEEAKRMI